MERRELIKTAGLLAFTGLAVNALADDHSQHGGSAPAKNTLSKSASDCVRTGEACLAHCIQMLSTGDTEMASCAKSVSQVIPLCAALQSLSNQNSAYAAKLAKVTMDACAACQKECEKFPQHDVCKACGEACAECYKQCEKIAA